MRRWGVVVLVVAVMLVALLAAVAPSSGSGGVVRASGGGPVFLDGSDAGYHGGVYFDAVARTRTLQSGWVSIRQWYSHLLASVPGSYAHDGTVAVLGSAGLNNDVDDDFVPDDPVATRSHCGAATFEVGRELGVNLVWYDGSVAIAAFLDAVAAGTARPKMIHIVEHTPAAYVGSGSALCVDGLRDDELGALDARAAALATHVNRGGALYANDQPYGWLERLYRDQALVNCSGSSGLFTAAGSAAFPMAPAIDAQMPYHSCFSTVDGPVMPAMVTDGSLVVAIGGASVVMPLSPGAPSTTTTTTTVPSVMTPSPTPPSGGAAPVIGGGAPATTVPGCGGVCVDRLYGEDRFATAAVTAQQRWGASGASSAVVALGTNFPDAVVAGPLAAKRDVPVLLVRRDATPADTLEVIDRLGVSSVVVTGGEAAVAAKVERELVRNGVTVTRRWGEDRYGTSAAVAAEWGGVGNGRIYVARGDVFTDQLVAAAAAARYGSPLLLIPPDGSVPAAVRVQIERLRPGRLIVVGVDPPPADALDALGVAAQVSTITAVDPYALSLAVVGDGLFPTVDSVVVALGEDFADALAAVPVAARLDQPVVLTRRSCIPASVADFFETNDVEDAIVLGGPAAVFSDFTRLDTLCT